MIKIGDKVKLKESFLKRFPGWTKWRNENTESLFLIDKIVVSKTGKKFYVCNKFPLWAQEEDLINCGKPQNHPLTKIFV